MKIATGKALVAGLCWILACTGFTAQGKEGIYKKVDDALNERIRADVIKHFAAGPAGVASMMKDFCICVPFYLEAIKGRAGVTFLHSKPAPLTSTGTGLQLKDQMDMNVLAKQLSADAGLNPVVRKLTEDEIKLLVSRLPIEMEEPIFMLENQGKKYVVLMGEDNSRNGIYFIVFVDQFP